MPKESNPIRLRDAKREALKLTASVLHCLATGDYTRAMAISSDLLATCEIVVEIHRTKVTTGKESRP